MGENEPQAFHLGNSEFIPSSDGVQDLSLEHRTVTTAPPISHSPMPDTSSIGYLVQ